MAATSEERSAAAADAARTLTAAAEGEENPAIRRFLSLAGRIAEVVAKDPDLETREAQRGAVRLIHLADGAAASFAVVDKVAGDVLAELDEFICLQRCSSELKDCSEPRDAATIGDPYDMGDLFQGLGCALAYAQCIAGC